MVGPRRKRSNSKRRKKIDTKESDDMMDAMIWCMPVIGWGVILTALVFGINLLACALEYHRERRHSHDA